jgi:UDP-glucose 4-epimerase
VTGRRVPYRVAPRRAGDPPELVASAARIAADTGWRGRLSGLPDIVRTAYAWREAHPHGYRDEQREHPPAVDRS